MMSLLPPIPYSIEKPPKFWITEADADHDFTLASSGTDVLWLRANPNLVESPTGCHAPNDQMFEFAESVNARVYPTKGVVPLCPNWYPPAKEYPTVFAPQLERP